MKYIRLYEKFEDDFEEVWEEDPADDKIRKHKLPKIFVDFLNEKDVLYKFIYNFERRHPNMIWYDFAFNMDIGESIGASFTWHITPERWGFWNKLHREWQKILYSDPNYKYIYNKKIKEFKINSGLYENFENDFDEVWEEEPDETEYDYVKKHKLPIIFYDFLKKEGILDIFINNFERRNQRNIFYENMIIRDAYLSELINYAFYWGNTPEGTSFWTKISRKWQNIPGLNRKIKNLKDDELYESFDFEETWIQDEPVEEEDLPKLNIEEYTRYIGRTVRIKKTSEHYNINNTYRGCSNPVNMDGKITEIYKTLSCYIRVKWNNRSYNCYNYYDLVLKNY